MYIANIFPVNNQELYQGEKMAMILAPLLKKGLYKAENFKDTYVILDNGLYEKSMVSTSLQDLIDLAEASDIVVDEIVVPDCMGDWLTTRFLFEKNLEIIRKNPGYRFMIVAHAENEQQLGEIIDYLNQFDGLPLVVGIPKRVPFDRGNLDAKLTYMKCRFPVHFLGIQHSFSELEPVWYKVRSCDSSQAVCAVAENADNNIWEYHREGNPVSIECDTIDISRIKRVLKEIKRFHE